VGKTESTKYTDKTVLSGTTYKYKVRAYILLTQHFFSAYSNEVTAKTVGEATTQIGVVKVDDVLNVRAEPKTSGTILVQLKTGTTVYVISKTGDWYKVTFVLDGQSYTGYAHADYITITNSDITKPACPYTEPTSTMKSGSAGDGVKWVQWHLYKLGYLSKSSDIDGDFGSTTLSAVKKFQEDKGLDVDGVVGSGTRSKLKSEYQKA
jgi:murein L,D-transpeptidase YcbB/YkuD